MLVIFLTESEKDIDWTYINDFLKRFFDVTSDHKILNIPLKGKTRYNDKGTIKKINQACKKYEAYGHPNIILCVDVDKENIKDIQDLNEQIEVFCTNNNWNLVWFNEDIEELFLGRKIYDNKKFTKAKAFKKQQKIQEISKNKFQTKDPRKHKASSNLFTVLQSFFDEKTDQELS